MVEKVLRYINKYNMVEPGQGVVVGVSGGADSLALIHLLCQIRNRISISLYIAHVNHGLRGQEAVDDAEFVRAIAERWDLKFFLKEARVSELAKEWSLSEEQAGRRVRYDFFHSVLREVRGHKIALAHHSDDQAETIMHNIIRGTGLSGLSGMEPVRDGSIIRPLLCVSRGEIEDYCRQNGLEYREDRTNLDTIYTRNRIRGILIPLIEEQFNPNFSQSLLRMGDILGEDEEFLAKHAEKIFNSLARHGDNEVRFSIEGLKECPKAIRRRVLRRGLERLKKDLTNIGYVHIEALLRLIWDSQAGSRINLIEGLVARKDYEELVLYFDSAGCRQRPLPVPDFEYELDIPGVAIIPQLNLVITVEGIEPPRVLDQGDGCIYIDEEAIKNGLTVRNRRDGDRFRPLGMSGTKKLKDYFIDQKVPRDKRDSIALVVDEDNIIWVAGYRMSEDYRIKKDTKKVLKIEVKDLLHTTFRNGRCITWNETEKY
ncbi:MAG: tRNA lysidine(34) synthetase TilS [Clostridiales bacterium]|nr:tRNA lysidine(34) synthetase TilS [Clostridiales bacterium]